MAPVPSWRKFPLLFHLHQPVCYLPTSLQFPLYAAFITAVFIQVWGIRLSWRHGKERGLCAFQALVYTVTMPPSQLIMTRCMEWSLQFLKLIFQSFDFFG